MLTLLCAKAGGRFRDCLMEAAYKSINQHMADLWIYILKTFHRKIKNIFSRGLFVFGDPSVDLRLG